MNRSAFQQLADERLLDASSLLAAGNWAGSYYLAGYTVECGLKSCVLARVAADQGVLFDEKNFSARCWTHDLETLLGLADLIRALNADFQIDTLLKAHWLIVKNWNEMSRYLSQPESEARKLLSAINHPTSGILAWLRKHW